MKNNFLNNQNYILWKTEKKKLLSKFFVENSIKNIFSILTKIYNIINEYLVKILIFSLFIFFIVVIFKIYWISLYLLIFIFLIFLAYLSYKSGIKKRTYSSNYSYLWKSSFYLPKKTEKIFSITNFKSYFLYWDISKEKWTSYNFFYSSEDNKWERNMITMKIFLIFPAIYSPIYTYDAFFVGKVSISLFLWLNIFFLSIYVYFIFRFKVINTLLFPFLFIYILFIFIISIINIFLLKWINWYNFIKNTPEKNILKKFDTINKKFAQNKFYEIKIK